jgi:hypothetical protein
MRGGSRERPAAFIFARRLVYSMMAYPENDVRYGEVPAFQMYELPPSWRLYAIIVAAGALMFEELPPV